MSKAEGKRPLKTVIVERLHNPLQLRIAVCGVLLLGWYFGVYSSYSEEISVTTRRLTQEKKRLDIAKRIESLRAESKSFSDRLPAERDPNEFIQYVIEGIRQHPLKLVTLTPERSRDVGPFQAVVMRIELEGKFQDAWNFLGWLEFNPRLIRVDSIKIDPHRKEPNAIVMQIVVLGLMS